MPQCGTFLTWCLFSFLFHVSTSWLTRTPLEYSLLFKVVYQSLDQKLWFLLFWTVDLDDSESIKGVKLFISTCYALQFSLFPKKVLTSFANFLSKVFMHFISLPSDFSFDHFMWESPLLRIQLGDFAVLQSSYFPIFNNHLNLKVLPFFSHSLHTWIIFVVCLG
jgi:hypothetical protein